MALVNPQLPHCALSEFVIEAARRNLALQAEGIRMALVNPQLPHCALSEFVIEAARNNLALQAEGIRMALVNLQSAIRSRHIAHFLNSSLKSREEISRYILKESTWH